MTDKRKVLRATPPESVGKMGRMVQFHIDSNLYEKVYFGAFDAEQSLADYIRDVLRNA